MIYMYRRWLIIGLVMLFGSLAAVPTFAVDAPKIVVAPAWRPGATLDTIDVNANNMEDAGDEWHFVDADIYVTSSVQFWTAQLSCTATPAALTSYNDPNDNTATGDGSMTNTMPAVTWGPDWGVKNSQYAEIIDPFNAAAGSRSFIASRLGNIVPMGTNGVEQTFLLATLRYRVKAVNANATATLTCTSSFLNRNGAVVLAATYTPPTPLTVIQGYTISGSVLYQGRTAHAGISIECTEPSGAGNFNAVTNAVGAWSQITRVRSRYTCTYFGNALNKDALYQPDTYLASATQFTLTDNNSYTLLPVTLDGGNFPTDQSANKDEGIALADIAVITAGANWNKPVPAGDVNGDAKTDRVDFAIATGNYGLSEVGNANHVIYSLPRNNEAWQNSRLWLGDISSGSVAPFATNAAADSRDLWPMLSPDGKSIAFVRDTTVNGVHTTALFTAPITNGVAATPVRLTPADAPYQAFAL